MDKDVAERNGLEEKIDDDAEGSFVVKPAGVGQSFCVRGPPKNKTFGQPRSVLFKLEDNKIKIGHPDTGTCDPMVLTVEWNSPTNSCVLRLGDRQVTAEEISQMALEPLFFK